MNILLCGHKDECLMTNELLKSELTDSEAQFCEDGEKLLELLAKHCFDLAIVLLDGAGGMETVITLKRQCPLLPIIWFSDDAGFAAQSYRIGVAYFRQKPVTAQTLKNAVFNCEQTCINGGKSNE